MPVSIYILTALAAYLLGSIPFGFLAAKAKGIDIRSVGSGNIGATNAMRVLGKSAGITVLVLDALKGSAACLLGVLIPIYFSHDLTGLHSTASATGTNSFEELFNSFRYLPILAGIFAVLGHNYTCWLKFKGGKGIATTAGVYLALAPWALLVALLVFIVVLLVSRIVSVASMTAAVALPVTVWAMSPDNLVLGIVTTALGALAIYKHKSNIQRLLAGTENRFGKKKESQ